MKFWKTLSSKRLSNSHKNSSNGGDDAGGGVYKAPVNVLSSVSTTPALTRRRSNGNRDVGLVQIQECLVNRCRTM